MVMRYQDTDLKATISVGVSTFPRDDSDPSELLRKADVALYRSKEEGRNRVTVFSEPPPGELAETSTGRKATHDQDGVELPPDSPENVDFSSESALDVDSENGISELTAFDSHK
jgi:hypothetical protein